MTDDEEAGSHYPDLAVQPASHPDAQTTVTDFLDYTDYYPSDLGRSLTLIGKLDQAYIDATHKVHQLTTIYGDIPNIPLDRRPDPQDLRRQISEALERAMICRESAHEEASRLLKVTDRHAHRLGTIKRKLEALPKPPSRDPTPVPVSPNTRRQQEAARAPRIHLHLESVSRPSQKRPLAGTRDDYSSDDDSSDEDGLGSNIHQANLDRRGRRGRDERYSGATRMPKPPRVPKAGISTSNALAKLTPPPPDPIPGSKYAPWLKLTQWEMAKLRKTMKKNAVWTPSETMVKRELTDRGRGHDNKAKAKADAEAKGVPFIDEEDEPDAPSDPAPMREHPPDEVGQEGEEEETRKETEAVKPTKVSSQSEKPKREALAKEGTKKKGAAAESDKPKSFEAVNSLISQTSDLMMTLFSSGATPTASEKKKSQSAKKKESKRKRDPSPDTPNPQADNAPGPMQETPTAQPAVKKIKINPPSTKSQQTPVPLPSSASPIPPPSTTALKSTATLIPLAPAGPSTPAPVTVSARQQELLPSPTEDQTTPVPTPAAIPTTAAASRSRRNSESSKPRSSPIPEHPPQILKLTNRPSSRGSTAAKAMSAEPIIKQEQARLHNTRRASNVSLPVTAEVAPPLISTRSLRPNRKPAPGQVTVDADGTGKTAVGSRKKGHKRSKSEDDRSGVAAETNDDEELYCLCNDVSWGSMIACSAEETCVKQWFHFECVGIQEGSNYEKRRAKWYCPDCRTKLKVDETGKPTTLPQKRK